MSHPDPPPLRIRALRLLQDELSHHPRDIGVPGRGPWADKYRGHYAMSPHRWDMAALSWAFKWAAEAECKDVWPWYFLTPDAAVGCLPAHWRVNSEPRPQPGDLCIFRRRSQGRPGVMMVEDVQPETGKVIGIGVVTQKTLSVMRRLSYADWPPPGLRCVFRIPLP